MNGAPEAQGLHLNPYGMSPQHANGCTAVEHGGNRLITGQ